MFGCRLRQQAVLLQEAVRMVTVECRQLAVGAEAAGSGGAMSTARTGAPKTATLEMCRERPWQIPLSHPQSSLART